MATPTEKKLKVILAKSDQDAHDRGIRFLAELLRDAGMEVVFIRYRIADEVAQVALQEDADVVGLSFYGSGLLYDTGKVLELLRKHDASHIGVVVGGTIAADDVPKLQEMGVAGVFGPGSPTDEMIRCIASIKGSAG